MTKNIGDPFNVEETTTSTATTGIAHLFCNVNLLENSKTPFPRPCQTPVLSGWRNMKRMKKIEHKKRERP
jgi:hypothetical protein